MNFLYDLLIMKNYEENNMYKYVNIYILYFFVDVFLIKIWVNKLDIYL